MGVPLLANNAVSRLATPLAAAGNQLTLQAGDGNRFPSPKNGDWVPLTLVKPADTGVALEHVRATARNGDVLTISRAQEGSTAQDFPAGTIVELRLTAGVLEGKADKDALNAAGLLGRALDVSTGAVTDLIYRRNGLFHFNDTVSGRPSDTNGMMSSNFLSDNWGAVTYRAWGGRTFEARLEGGKWSSWREMARIEDLAPYQRKDQPLTMPATGGQNYVDQRTARCGVTVEDPKEGNRFIAAAKVVSQDTGGYSMASSFGTLRHGAAKWGYTTIHSLGDNGSQQAWYFVHENGNLEVPGNVAGFSDRRLKTDIQTIRDALAKVRQLHGVVYTRVDSGERQTGLIAQDVQAVLPEAVIESADEARTLAVAYGNLAGLFVQALKELDTRVANLEGGRA